MSYLHPRMKRSLMNHMLDAMGENKAEIDPALVWLIDRLPSPGSDWPLDERAKWINAFSACLTLIYDPADIPTDLPAVEEDTLGAARRIVDLSTICDLHALLEELNAWGPSIARALLAKHATKS